MLYLALARRDGRNMRRFLRYALGIAAGMAALALAAGDGTATKSPATPALDSAASNSPH